MYAANKQDGWEGFARSTYLLTYSASGGPFIPLFCKSPLQQTNNRFSLFFRLLQEEKLFSWASGNEKTHFSSEERDFTSAWLAVRLSIFPWLCTANRRTEWPMPEDPSCLRDSGTLRSPLANRCTLLRLTGVQKIVPEVLEAHNACLLSLMKQQDNFERSYYSIHSEPIHSSRY